MDGGCQLNSDENDVLTAVNVNRFMAGEDNIYYIDGGELTIEWDGCHVGEVLPSKVTIAQIR